MPADTPTPATTPRKKPIMNNPYMTQTQTEARLAARLANTKKVRRALRLDNPRMWGNRAGAAPTRADRIPTPTYRATA